MFVSDVKTAATDHSILEPLRVRYSPYVFDPRPVEAAKLQSCLEAARWAASSFNEQPWVFLIARREETAAFEQMLSCLMEANQVWAKNAGVLMLTAIRTTFTRNGTPNRVAEHDLGLAMGNFTVQATSLGLAVHQMAGVELAKVRTTYHVPETHNPLTAVAVGYAGDPAKIADQNLAARDQAPRPRKPLSEIVFAGDWGQAAELGK